MDEASKPNKTTEEAVIHASPEKLRQFASEVLRKENVERNESDFVAKVLVEADL